MILVSESEKSGQNTRCPAYSAMSGHALREYTDQVTISGVWTQSIPSGCASFQERHVHLIQSCTSLLGVMCQNCQSSINIREEFCFLARESSDEYVVSTIACAVETTIDACAVLCGVST
jgi:hypothetical protein